ncbi:hypothetical protein [Eggerthella sinensis]|nr:hypothetical protein [Eggerthella sinensis]
MSANANKRRGMVVDERGASIVIALVFFLICGVVGSVVVTAASVQAKSVETHVDLQQDEYTMQSAAELVAQQLGGEDLTWNKKSVVVKVSYADGKTVVDIGGVASSLGQSLWTQSQTDAILAKRAKGESYVVGASDDNRLKIESKVMSNLKTVYGKITIDPDLNITVDLSLSPSLSADSQYNMTVYIQCTPSYDVKGRLVEFSYGDNTVIEKTSGGAS